MGTSGGGGGESSGYGENFAKSSGQNWNSSGSDTRNLNVSQSRTNQDVWDPQKKYLTGGYDAAAKMGLGQAPQYQQAANDAQNWNKAVGGVMTPVMKQQAAGGIYAQGGAGENFRGEAGKLYNEGLGQSQWGGQSNFGDVNGYTDSLKRSIGADARVAGDQMMNQMDARGAASGMSGGSRHGTAIAQGMNDINRSMLNTQGQIGFQANEQAQNRRMQSEEAERARRMSAGEAQMGRRMRGGEMYQDSLNTQEATTNAMVGNTGNIMDLGMKGFDPLTANWGNVQNYMGAIGGPNNLSNSATDSLNMSATQQRGSGGGANQSDAYGWTSSDSMTNPSWNFSLPSSPKQSIG